MFNKENLIEFIGFVFTLIVAAVVMGLAFLVGWLVSLFAAVWIAYTAGILTYLLEIYILIALDNGHFVF